MHCNVCGSDLTKNNTVIRYYLNKENNKIEELTGQYNGEGLFESNKSLHGHHDPIDGDTCTNCLNIIG